MAGRVASSRRLNPDDIRNVRSFFDDTYARILDYSSNLSILKPSSSGKRNIDLLSNDEEDNDEPSAKSSSPTGVIDLCSSSSDGGDDDDSSNANDQCSISSSSSSDGDVDFDDEDYNDEEEEYDDNDGGGKVREYTNYRNIFQESPTSDCGCIVTHDDCNRWTTPTFVASLEYRPNGILIPPVTIPKCDQYLQLKEFAATEMRAHPEYKTPHGYATVNYIIFVMSQLTTSTPCVMFMSLKCTSVRKGVSVGIWGTNDPGVDPMMCPTFQVINAMANILPHTGINFGNRGFPFGCLNARTTCAHDDKGRCLDWTILEAEFIAFLLTILGFVCGMMGVPVMYFDMGGAGSRRLYSRLKLALSLFRGGKYRRMMEQYVHCFPIGTHASNAVVRKRGPWKTVEEQAKSVSMRLRNTSEALSSFMDAHVGPSCDARRIPRPISRDLFQALATDKTMRFVHALTNTPSQMRDLITATQKIHDIPLRLYRRLEKIWDNNLRALAVYNSMQGHTLVPQAYVANGLKLGVWVNNQRTQYNLKEKGERSFLTDKRERLLNNLSFAWSARDEIWDNNLRELAEYKIDHNGNVCVPREYVVNRLNLGVWVSNLRAQYTLRENGEHNDLTNERVRLLNDLTFVWKVQEAQWLENYETLIKYKNDNNGNVCVPKRYKTGDGTTLGVWVSVQRTQYTLKERNERSQITDERIRLLNDLEFVWRLRG